MCPIKVVSNTNELTVHTSCYWVLDLLGVTTLLGIFPRTTMGTDRESTICVH